MLNFETRMRRFSGRIFISFPRSRVGMSSPTLCVDYFTRIKHHSLIVKRYLLFSWVDICEPRRDIFHDNKVVGRFAGKFET